MHKPSTISRIAASTLQRKVGEVLRRVAVNGEHLIIERDGFPIAVLVPLSQYEDQFGRKTKPTP